MAIKFTKGGILNSSQLEDISGKKWKKGGILSATQLNELSGGGNNNKSVKVNVVNETSYVFPFYAITNDGLYSEIRQAGNTTEQYDLLAFASAGGYSTPFGTSYSSSVLSVEATTKSGATSSVQGQTTGSTFCAVRLFCAGSEIADDVITVTISMS